MQTTSSPVSKEETETGPQTRQTTWKYVLVTLIGSVLLMSALWYTHDPQWEVSKHALERSTVRHSTTPQQSATPATTSEPLAPKLKYGLPSIPPLPGCGPYCPIAPDDVGVTKFAYVFTPADSAYFLATLVAAHSLRLTGSTVDIVIAYLSTEHTINELLLQKARDLGYILRPAQPPPSVNVIASYDMSAMKISEPWGMEEYDKIIYLDMDNIVFRNIDHLFFCPEISAVNHWDQLGRTYDKDCHSCDCPDRKWLMSAMMVLRPDSSKVAPILSCGHPGITFMSDMDYLNCYWKCDMNQLPVYYQHIDNPAYPSFDNETYVVHWSCGKKPFWGHRVGVLTKQEPVPNPDGCKLSDAWHSMFFDAKLDEIVRSPQFIW